jgi:hypothetical protein
MSDILTALSIFHEILDERRRPLHLEFFFSTGFLPSFDPSPLISPVKSDTLFLVLSLSLSLCLSYLTSHDNRTALEYYSTNKLSVLSDLNIAKQSDFHVGLMKYANFSANFY